MTGKEMPSEYIGDAVRVSFDGWQLCLHTEDGNNQEIFLEPEVFQSLVNFARKNGWKG